MQQQTTTISPDGQWDWNGTEWVPNATNAMTGAPAPPLPVAVRPQKKRLGKTRLAMKITGGLLGVLLILGIATAGGEDTGAGPASRDVASAPVAAEDKAAGDQAASETEAPEMTVSQQNAVESGESYLDTSAFSRKGLIQQLSSEYGEGFPKADATFAVDYLEDTGAVNWNAEAAEAAEAYLETSSFSRQGLVQQLESEYGEGFTHKQAVYGVDQTGL